MFVLFVILLNNFASIRINTEPLFTFSTPLKNLPPFYLLENEYDYAIINNSILV